MRNAPIFPAQRRAARQQAAAALEKVSAKVAGRTPRRRLPRPAVWLLGLLGAAAFSVLVGFVLGLAQPRTRGEGQV